jgi:hypothetical protein
LWLGQQIHKYGQFNISSVNRITQTGLRKRDRGGEIDGNAFALGRGDDNITDFEKLNSHENTTHSLL